MAAPTADRWVFAPTARVFRQRLKLGNTCLSSSTGCMSHHRAPMTHQFSRSKAPQNLLNLRVPRACATNQKVRVVFQNLGPSAPKFVRERTESRQTLIRPLDGMERAPTTKQSSKTNFAEVSRASVRSRSRLPSSKKNHVRRMFKAKLICRYSKHGTAVLKLRLRAHVLVTNPCPLVRARAVVGQTPSLPLASCMMAIKLVLKAGTASVMCCTSSSTTLAIALRVVATHHLAVRVKSNFAPSPSLHVPGKMLRMMSTPT